MGPQNVPAIPRTKYEFCVVRLDVKPSDLQDTLNNLGSRGFALSGSHTLFEPVGNAPGIEHHILLMARPIGLDIIGPGILG